MSDFAKFSELDSIFLCFSRSQDRGKEV